MDRRLFLALAAGVAAAPLRARSFSRPPALRRLRLANPHTGETFDGAYRNENGPLPDAIKDLCIFLRDFHSGDKIQMDVGVIDFLADVMDAVGESSAIVLSAYRNRETNAMLARTTFGVAENSQHLYGRALDIRLDRRLADAMVGARAMMRGGVGWYPNSGFIHLDTGPVRNWTMKASALRDLLDGGRSSSKRGGPGGGNRDRSIGGAKTPMPPVATASAQQHSRLYETARAEFLARSKPQTQSW